MSGIGLQFTAAGPIATPPALLNADLIAAVAAINPGYTATLPGSLIEDLSSTATGALIAIDQARVDAVNNVSPYAANPFILAQMGAQFGVPQGLMSNASVYVVITGSPGYVIPPGFAVSDGSRQYIIQTGGTVSTTGTTASLYAVCLQAGSFAIPAGTVTTIVTSVPSPYTLTVTNPLGGTPAAGPQTIESYRAQIVQAFQVAMTGTAAYLKTLLTMLPGVPSRLVSVVQSGQNFEILCGGGDPYQTAGAIYQSGVILGLLTGSLQLSRNVNVSIYDAPDTYNIVFVNPPQQIVTIGMVWNTTLPNFTSGPAVAQFAIVAMQAYINSIVVGQGINLLVLQQQVQAAISSVLAPVNLTTLRFNITINGVLATPSAGTSTILSDPESYFYLSPTGATCVQG